MVEYVSFVLRLFLVIVIRDDVRMVKVVSYINYFEVFVVFKKLMLKM